MTQVSIYNSDVRLLVVSSLKNIIFNEMQMHKTLRILVYLPAYYS